MERKRISNGALQSYEDLIAVLVRIQREMDAIKRSMDIDTRTFNYDRIGVIHKAAAAARHFVQERMNADKDAAGQ